MSLILKSELLARYAKRNLKENHKFRSFVKHHLDLSDTRVDATVRKVTEGIWAKVDCLDCGACCKGLQIAIDDEDIQRLAKRLKMTIRNFENRFVVKSSDNEKSLASPPCPFLDGNTCTVYEDRPKACKDFPYLYEPHFRGRMLMLIDNTFLCPIVFNTVEALKAEFGFARKNKLG